VAAGSTTWHEIHDEFVHIQHATEAAFNAAANEPKITSREALEATNSAPEVTAGRPAPSAWAYSNSRDQKAPAAEGAKAGAPEVMRKLMTQLFDEALGGHTPAGKHAVYLGEDVRHGG
jgi:hypothetical protein